jgi:hypothetical protein
MINVAYFIIFFSISVDAADIVYQTVLSGDSVTFQCQTNGMEYRWDYKRTSTFKTLYIPGKTSSDTSQTYSANFDVNASRLTVFDIKLNDAGFYRCFSPPANVLHGVELVVFGRVARATSAALSTVKHLKASIR